MWFKKSAEQGNADAQHRLGLCYENGLGTTRNYAQAFKWYKKSAEQGNAVAQYMLGKCYENGLGTIQNKSQALYWYKEAAAQGHLMAQSAQSALEKENARVVSAYENTQTTQKAKKTQNNYTSRKVRNGGGWRRFWENIGSHLYRGYGSHVLFIGIDRPLSDFGKRWGGGFGYEHISKSSIVTMLSVDVFDILFDEFSGNVGFGVDLFDGFILCAVGGVGRGILDESTSDTGFAWKAGGEVQWLINDDRYLLRLGVSYKSTLGVVGSLGCGFAF